jgi:hypothetical protein
VLRAARGAVRPRRVLVFRQPGAAVAETSSELAELTFADAVRLARGPAPFPYVLRRRLLERFREGYRFFALRKDGELVSFIWAVVATELYVSEADAMLRDAGPGLWFTDAVTPEAHRGHGYYPQLLRAVMNAIPAPTVLLYCVASNAASRNGILKAGFAPAGEIVAVAGSRRLRQRTAASSGLEVARRVPPSASPPAGEAEAAGAKPAAAERQATAGAGGRS